MVTLSSILPPVNISTTSGTLAVGNGGTGATTLTGVVKGNGTSAMTAGTVTVAEGGTGATTLTANAVVIGNGTGALQTVAPGTAGNVLSSNGTTWTSAAPVSSSGQITAVASGSLSDGTKVVVNSNGTVSAIQSTGGPPFANSEFIFRSASTNAISSVYDSVNQRVVIAYQDGGSSNQGFSVVGSVSGTTITFGTPVRFSSTVGVVQSTSVVYDSVNQKVVICYSVFDSGASIRYVNAVVGTVSGTSISFGSIVQADSSSFAIGAVSATYDLNAQKIVIVYTVNNSVVDRGAAVVGTVSGTSITFGTVVIFKATATSQPTATYDPSVQRIVVAYTDAANSNFGTAVIATVSGTTISFGTPVVFRSVSTGSITLAYDITNQKMVFAYIDGPTGFGISIVGTSTTTSISFGTAVDFNSASCSSISLNYDANLQKVVVAFRQGSTGFGSAVVGTVSGTSISFGSATVFNTASTQATSIAYMANIQNMVISFQDTGNSSFGTSLVFQTSGPNLTATNFIGISNGAYSNGQTATIQTVGSTDDAQTGLTAGSLYYVLSNGSLSLTAGSPSVVAGTAISATKLIIKG
jgi:hypothetical protein